jgi:hypothetical protein
MYKKPWFYQIISIVNVNIDSSFYAKCMCLNKIGINFLDEKVVQLHTWI